MTLDELLRIRSIDRDTTPWLTFPVVQCPHCQADVTQSMLIVCSRHCEHCGTRVIDPDPEGDEPAPEEVIALPTIDEYIEEVTPYRRIVCWVSGMMACAFGFGICMMLIIRASVPGGGPEWLTAVILGWILVGIPLINIGSYMMLTIRTASNPTLVCPQCKQVDVEESERIISSRCCAKCGMRQLLDNPVTEGTPTTLYSLPSIIDHRKYHERIQQIKNHIAKCIFVIFVMMPMFIASFAGIGVREVVGVALVVCMAVQLAYMLYINMIHALRCSCCHGRLRNHGIIIATKHCYHCGERVIAKPDTLPLEIGHDAE